jgi:hypothetical protein
MRPLRNGDGKGCIQGDLTNVPLWAFNVRCSLEGIFCLLYSIV